MKSVDLVAQSWGGVANPEIGDQRTPDDETICSGTAVTCRA